MFRRVGLSLLTVLMFTLLQGAALFAGITNGTFDADVYDPLKQWDDGWIHSSPLEITDDEGNIITFEEVVINGTDYCYPGWANIKETEGSTNYLYQNFSKDCDPSSLRFDLRFVADGATETDTFNAYLFQGNIGNPPQSKPANLLPFYWISTSMSDPEILEGETLATITNEDKIVLGLETWFIRTVTIPIPSQWSQAVIWFELVGEEDTVTASAFVDNVSEICTVPEPTTMTLGLIGVGVVGAIRRKIR